MPGWRTSSSRSRLRRVSVSRPDRSPLERLAATVETRWPAIGAYLPLHVTNARTEGYNKIKHIQRVACAFCDQHSQERRILLNNAANAA